MEEIDIIELLKRVKEGNAPKRIEINDNVYERDMDEADIEFIYRRDIGTFYKYWIKDEEMTVDTKIKILDKPKIEKLQWQSEGKGISRVSNNVELMEKVNEIIDYINKREDK